jgi:hypothetical protein
VWLGVLLAAEAWGCPPWEVAEGGSRLVWFLRWRELAAQRAKKQAWDSGEVLDG